MDEISTKYYTSTIPRLDPEKKEAWITWLLSEKYKGRQGRQALKKDGKFCCLGVYCQETKVPSWQQREDGSHVTYFGDPMYHSRGFIPRGWRIPYEDDASYGVHEDYRGSETVFEAAVQGERGETEESRPRNWYPFSLPILNDDDFTFEQIADVIRYFL